VKINRADWRLDTAGPTGSPVASGGGGRTFGPLRTLGGKTAHRQEIEGSSVLKLVWLCQRAVRLGSVCTPPLTDEWPRIQPVVGMVSQHHGQRCCHRSLTSGGHHTNQEKTLERLKRCQSFVQHEKKKKKIHQANSTATSRSDESGSESQQRRSYLVIREETAQHYICCTIRQLLFLLVVIRSKWKPPLI